MSFGDDLKKCEIKETTHKSPPTTPQQRLCEPYNNNTKL